MRRWSEFLLALAAAVALVLLFWWPLAAGAGLVGGDLYNYYFPLKQFYAEGLHESQLRLWHPGIGNGVPVLGEGQTGALYPPYLIGYRLFSLNTAYNVAFCGHYALAFLWCYALARCRLVGRWGALLAATVWVYGWFPARACLEWGIVTGSWLPLVLLGASQWMRTAQVRWGLLVSVSLALQLLAGHFQLAFVTLLGVAVFAIAPSVREESAAQESGFAPRRRSGRLGALGVWVALGFGLAAPQLYPTWRFKQITQRADADFADRVVEGNIPWWYLRQLVSPVDYFRADEVLREGGASTNMVEAHLYISLVGVALVVGGALTGRLRQFPAEWGLVALGLILGTGLGGQWWSHWPGFGYFRYPGRYGLLAQLGLALLAGFAVDQLRMDRPRQKFWLTTALLAAVVADLWVVSRLVGYVHAVYPATIDLVERSRVFALLSPADRVLAPDGNTLALSPASCVPPYLGLEPRVYRDWIDFPDIFHEPVAADPRWIDFLRSAGVTHILSERALAPSWPVTPLFVGVDPFLHRRWGRSVDEPLYLYRFRPGRRAYALDPTTGERLDAEVTVEPVAWDHVRLRGDFPGPVDLVLADLHYPGWQVWVDGVPAEAKTIDHWRGVRVRAGTHTVDWRYRPVDFHAGLAIAVVSFLSLSVWAWRLRMPAKTVVCSAAPLAPTSP